MKNSVFAAVLVVSVACAAGPLTSAFVTSTAFSSTPRTCGRSLAAAEKEDTPSDTSWFKDAMGIGPEEPLFRVLSLKQGLTGFAVDPEIGFVGVLAGEDGPSQRFTYAIVTPRDKERVSTPEALCMVQLAGGLDLGSTVLPPEALAKLAADEWGESAEDLRPRISLSRVEAIANDENSINVSDINDTDTPPPSSPEREESIKERASKVLAAVKNLPGLTDSSLDEVVLAMNQHADESGEIDRHAFSALLETMRSNKTRTEPAKVKFVLTINVVDGNGITQREVSASTVSALGLSMRYKVPVSVSKEALLNGFDASSVSKRFPAFRPMNELLEDAKIMDGVIPSMYAKAAVDNDEKA